MYRDPNIEYQVPTIETRISRPDYRDPNIEYRVPTIETRIPLRCIEIHGVATLKSEMVGESDSVYISNPEY